MGPDKKKPSLFRRVRTKAGFYKSWALSMGLFVFIGKYLPYQALERHDLTGKNAIVTGSNVGLGKAMAMHLASMGANVYMVCRNMKKAEAARDDLLKQIPDAKLFLIELDTSSLDNVQKFCSDWAAEGKTIDILMHNAGAGCPPSAEEPYGPDNMEYMYVTNFLSNVLMTFLLEKYLAPDARIVFTTSPGTFLASFTKDFSTEQVKGSMEKGFHYPPKADPVNSLLYSNGKLMQLCFARALNWKYRAEGKDIVANAYSPGYAASDFFEKEGVHSADMKKDPAWYLLRRGLKLAIPSEEAGKTGVYLATSKSKKVTEKGAGKFWERMKSRTSSVDLTPDEVIERLWERWCADAEIDWPLLPTPAVESEKEKQ
ncbi:hypothetical protein ABW19_dt0205714 [Dactylella cylindrospora]|nr:hypothetical protein ABW19_dt0205714 [Dactylella cylindrospora]